MKIKDIANFNPETIGSTIKKINYIDTSSSFDGQINAFEPLSEPFPSRAQRLIRKNDILISSVRPNLLHDSFVTEPYDGYVASTGYIHLRLKNDLEVLPKYLYYVLTSNPYVEYYCSVASTSQSSYPSINKELIEELNISFPSLSKQAHIVDIMYPIYKHNLLPSHII